MKCRKPTLRPTGVILLNYFRHKFGNGAGGYKYLIFRFPEILPDVFSDQNLLEKNSIKILFSGQNSIIFTSGDKISLFVHIDTWPWQLSFCFFQNDIMAGPMGSMKQLAHHSNKSLFIFYQIPPPSPFSLQFGKMKWQIFSGAEMWWMLQICLLWMKSHTTTLHYLLD